MLLKILELIHIQCLRESFCENSGNGDWMIHFIHIYFLKIFHSICYWSVLKMSTFSIHSFSLNFQKNYKRKNRREYYLYELDNNNCVVINCLAVIWKSLIFAPILQVAKRSKTCSFIIISTNQHIQHLLNLNQTLDLTGI